MSSPSSRTVAPSALMRSILNWFAVRGRDDRHRDAPPRRRCRPGPGPGCRRSRRRRRVLPRAASSHDKNGLRAAPFEAAHRVQRLDLERDTAPQLVAEGCALVLRGVGGTPDRSPFVHHGCGRDQVAPSQPIVSTTERGDERTCCSSLTRAVAGMLATPTHATATNRRVRRGGAAVVRHVDDLGSRWEVPAPACASPARRSPRSARRRPTRALRGASGRTPRDR